MSKVRALSLRSARAELAGVDAPYPTLPMDYYGARRLLAAVLLQAVRDARRGSKRARAWLAGDGAVWADDLDIDADVVRAWAERITLTP